MAHCSCVNLGYFNEIKFATIFSSVYPVESCQKRSVDEVGKDDEGVGLVQVEQEDGRDEGHALDTAEVNLRPFGIFMLRLPEHNQGLVCNRRRHPTGLSMWSGRDPPPKHGFCRDKTRLDAE